MSRFTDIRYSQMLWVLGAGLMSWLFLSPSEAQASAVVAASIFGDTSNLAVAVRALMIIIAIVIVGAILIDAIASFQNGNISRGIIGSFAVLFSVILVVVIIPQMTDGPVAAAATLR